MQRSLRACTHLATDFLNTAFPFCSISIVMGWHMFYHCWKDIHTYIRRWKERNFIQTKFQFETQALPRAPSLPS